MTQCQKLVGSILFHTKKHLFSNLLHFYSIKCKDFDENITISNNQNFLDFTCFSYEREVFRQENPTDKVIPVHVKKEHNAKHTKGITQTVEETYRWLNKVISNSMLSFNPNIYRGPSVSIPGLNVSQSIFVA